MLSSEKLGSLRDKLQDVSKIKTSGTNQLKLYVGS